MREGGQYDQRRWESRQRERKREGENIPVDTSWAGGFFQRSVLGSAARVKGTWRDMFLVYMIGQVECVRILYV